MLVILASFVSILFRVSWDWPFFFFISQMFHSFVYIICITDSFFLLPVHILFSYYYPNLLILMEGENLTTCACILWFYLLEASGKIWAQIPYPYVPLRHHRIIFTFYLFTFRGDSVYPYMPTAYISWRLTVSLYAYTLHFVEAQCLLISLQLTFCEDSLSTYMPTPYISWRLTVHLYAYR